MPFYNRVVELAALRTLFAGPKSEMVIVHGRRGSGKSALLLEAIKGHRAIYYQATAEVLPQQLEDITEAIRTAAPGTILPGQFPSLEQALRAVSQLARAQPGQPLVMIIDELPYLAEAEPALESIVQRWWDQEVRQAEVRNLKVILSGSHVSWMQEHLLAQHGPLHNRRTAQMEIAPFSYLHAAHFYPTYQAEDRVRAFAIYGGLPSYLQEIGATQPLWDNVRQTILDPTARLAEEPDWLRFTDLRADEIYGSLLRAIATGRHSAGDIASAVGKDHVSDISRQLRQLQDMHLLARVVPVTGERGTRPQYQLTDPFLQFWYRYIGPLRNLLALRQFDAALTRIQADIDLAMTPRIFEAICRDYLWQALSAGVLPPELQFTDVGSWWIARKGAQDELDVVAMDGGRTVLVGECKWSNAPMDHRDLEGVDAALRLGATELNPIAHAWRVLYSRSGFTTNLAARAADAAEQLLLVTPRDLYAVGDGPPLPG
jgi:AAA+ ATPase superfamily predicted ATPase